MHRQSEKIVKQQYLPVPAGCPYKMVNFGPLAADISSLVWHTPANVNGFRVLAALLHGTLVVGVSQTAARNRGRHQYSAGRPSRWALVHILVLSSFFLSSFFLAYFHPSQIGCLPYFHTWCGLTANLECTSKMCCTRLTENTEHKKSPFWHHRTALSGCILAAEACINEVLRW